MRWRRVALLALGALFVGPWAVLQLRDDSVEPLPSITLPPGSDSVDVFVADWGYHTSILVPQPPGLGLGPPNDANAAYLEYAWGDRSFYMESNFWPHRLFATLLLPTESVTYVVGWPRAPRMSDGMRHLWARRIARPELARLYTSLEGSIRRAPDGGRSPPHPSARGYRGRFYPAHGVYLYWYSCNRWTVERLAAAGLGRSGAGVIVPTQVPGRVFGFAAQR
jgi:hypothetical protein